MTPGTLLRNRRSGRTVRVVEAVFRSGNGAVVRSPAWRCVYVDNGRQTVLQEHTIAADWEDAATRWSATPTDQRSAS